jgi:hypothetical protein
MQDPAECVELAHVRGFAFEHIDAMAEGVDDVVIRSEVFVFAVLGGVEGQIDEMPKTIVLEQVVECFAFGRICQWPWMGSAADFIGPDRGCSDVFTGKDLIDFLFGLLGQVLISNGRNGLMAFVAPRKCGGAKSQGEDADEESSFSAHFGKI